MHEKKHWCTIVKDVNENGGCRIILTHFLLLLFLSSLLREVRIKGNYNPITTKKKRRKGLCDAKIASPSPHILTEKGDEGEDDGLIQIIFRLDCKASLKCNLKCDDMREKKSKSSCSGNAIPNFLNGKH